MLNIEWLDRKSRMRRESHVRFCESFWGWFPRATRQLSLRLSRRIRGPSSSLKRQRASRVAGCIQPLGAGAEQHSQEGKKQPGV